MTEVNIMNSSKTPNPDRIYEVIANILQRRYTVKIEYTLTEKKGA